MNNSEQLQRLYSRLSRRDIEEFYAGYQLWLTEQRLAVLQEEIQALRQQIEQNAERLRQLQPPEGVMKLLATLREWGVKNVDLLDRLCERGEEWLQAMFRRLDTCRRLGLFDGDYARWCEHALEGAYDWLDSIDEVAAIAVEGTAQTEVVVPATEEEESGDGELTEDEFWRRLLHEEATASRLPAIAPAEVIAVDGRDNLVAAEQAAPAEVVPLPEEALPPLLEAEPMSVSNIVASPQELAHEAAEAGTPDSTGDGSLVSEASVPQTVATVPEPSPAPPVEPAIREYVGSGTERIAEAASNRLDAAAGEDEAQATLSSGEQEAEAAAMPAYYEFGAVRSHEAGSTAEEIILPEGQGQTEAGRTDEDASLPGSANEILAESDLEPSELTDAHLHLLSPASAEPRHQTPMLADQGKAASPAALAEQPETSEQSERLVENRASEESEPDERAAIAGKTALARQAEEEDTAEELHFWQRIFGRHGIEFD